jgi:hypothetical protein
MTRAQERLVLTHASARSLWGNRSYNLPSRFLDELPEQHVERDRLQPASWSNYGAPRQSQVVDLVVRPNVAKASCIRRSPPGRPSYLPARWPISFWP